MFDIQNYGSFIIAVVVFQIIPGAGTITILNATARNGVRIGMKAVFGTLAGDFIYMLAAALGLTAILSAYPGILRSAQWIGVAYLCWMGLKLLWASATEKPADMALAQGGWIYFRQAFTVSLTNPKVIVFFMAFFPQFLSSESSPVTLFTLMMHVTAISFIYQTSLVLVGNAITRRLSQCKYARSIATRSAGLAFIGFGVKLAFNNR